MSNLKQYIASRGTTQTPSIEELDALIATYEWFTAARIVRQKLSGCDDRRLALMAPWRSQSALFATSVDVEALTRLSPDDIIDRFLREEDLRIVARDDTPEEEPCGEAQFDDEDDIVSEELAEIYRAQGLCDRAVAIYRKLSLLNPEKSVYFAKLISKIDNNN